MSNGQEFSDPDLNSFCKHCNALFLKRKQVLNWERFSTARLLWPNGWSTDSSSPWSRIELPRDKSLDYLTVAIVSMNCWLFLWLLLSSADCFPAPLNLFLSSTHVLFLGHQNNQLYALFSACWCGLKGQKLLHLVFSAVSIWEGHFCLEFRLFYIFSNYILVVKPQWKEG